MLGGRRVTPQAICVCLLCFVSGCGLSDDASVEQPTRFRGSGTYRRIGDDKGGVVMIVFNNEGLIL